MQQQPNQRKIAIGVLAALFLSLSHVFGTSIEIPEKVLVADTEFTVTIKDRPQGTLVLTASSREGIRKFSVPVNGQVKVTLPEGRFILSVGKEKEGERYLCHSAVVVKTQVSK